ETGVANSVDPLGGSFQVETLTDALERDAEAIFAEIDDQGGMIAAIENGYFRRRIAESAFRFQSEVDAEKKLIVGVNAFTDETGLNIPTLEIDPDIETRQKVGLMNIRNSRDAKALRGALE